jgi:hypothetical protein
VLGITCGALELLSAVTEPLTDDRPAESWTPALGMKPEI